MEGMQTKICRNRQIFLCSSIAGRRDIFFIGCALATFVKKSLKCSGFEIIAYLCALKQSSKESRTWDKVIKQLNIRVIWWKRVNMELMRDATQRCVVTLRLGIRWGWRTPASWVVTHSSKKLMNFFIIGLLFLSGAERSKDNLFSFILWRRERTKRHPPSPRPLPIWRGCNTGKCRNRHFPSVLVSRDTACIAYRLRLEKEFDLNNLYHC